MLSSNGSPELTLTISDGEASDSVMQTITSGGSYAFLYEDFADIDFTAATSITATFDTEGDFTAFSLTQITREFTDVSPAVVPLPAGIPLMVGALGLFGFVRSRRG